MLVLCVRLGLEKQNASCLKNSTAHKISKFFIEETVAFLSAFAHISKGLELMESEEVMCAQKDKVQVKRKTLEAVHQQCQWSLQQLASGCDYDSVDHENKDPQEFSKTPSAPTIYDNDKAEFYGLFKSGVECADFIKKLENVKASLPENIAEEYSSWDMVDESDVWDGNAELDPEGYVLCFSWARRYIVP